MNQDEKEKFIDRVLLVMSGLLASGHYTESRPKEPDDAIKFQKSCPQVIRTDYGKDWRTDGFAPRRHASLAIEDAIDLVGELEKTIELDEKNNLPSEPVPDIGARHMPDTKQAPTLKP